MAAPNLTPLGVSTITGKTVPYAVTTTLAAVLTNSSGSNKVFKINSIWSTNIDGTNTADITVTHLRGGTDVPIDSAVTVPAKAKQIHVSRDIYFYLEEGDAIRAQASANADLVLFISYEEIS